MPTEAMVQAMLFQGVLDHPRVVPYLNLEKSKNVPLAVHVPPGLAVGTSLRAAGQPVRPTAKADARLVIERRESLPAAERVHFAIPPQGVVGHVDFVLRDNVWTAIDVRLVER